MKNQIGALPKDPIGVKFCQIFTHTWNFIQAKLDSLGYLARSWTTETRYPISPRNLWSKFKDPTQIVGLRFGSSTNYLVLDIDRHSIYHPKRSLKKYKEILHALEDVGLVRYIVIQSSYSEGIHIYFFLPEKVSTFKLAVAVQNALEDNGYYVKKGQLEIFPNVKAYGTKHKTNYNGIRLPLQPNTGSYILDDFSLDPISDSIEEFLDQAESTAQQQDLETLKEKIAAAKKRHKPQFVSNGSSQNKVAEWEKDLLARINEGWTAKGQTNDLLKDIACHGVVFKGFESDRLTRYIYETAIHSSGYRRWCRHQHEIHRRCEEWARCAQKYWKRLYSRPSRQETYREMWDKQTANKNNNINEKRHTEALDRIKQAVKRVINVLGELPELIGDRIKAICDAAKELTGKTFGRKTLYKNEFKEIWHPAYRNRDNTEVTQNKPSDDKVSDSGLYQTTVVTENGGEEKAPSSPVQKDCQSRPTPAPIHEGNGALLQPPEAPQECREGAVNSMEGGPRGDEGSRTAPDSNSSGDKPVRPEREDNVPRKEKDRLNGQETLAEGKNSEALHQEKNSPLTAGDCTDSEAGEDGDRSFAANANSGENTSNKQPSLSDYEPYRVLKLKMELNEKARNMARLEVMSQKIDSAAEKEAIEMRIKSQLYRESGEPALIAEVEKWETVACDRTKSKASEDGEQLPAAAQCASHPDPNNQKSSLPYPNFFKLLKLRMKLTVEARKMAELEAAERGIKSKNSIEIEAIKRRILNELFRESGEPVLIAEVEKWEDENF